jgi:hypothetical protein
LSTLALLVQRYTLIANFLIRRGILRSKNIEAARPVGTIAAKVPCLLIHFSSIFHRENSMLALHHYYPKPSCPVQGGFVR